jgi:dihydroxyacetone kinase
MTSTRTNAGTFSEISLAGIVSAHRDTLVAVEGGVVLRQRKRGHVAVVVGGGSGHFPAFAGLVGSGLGTAAVCGGIFASPSAGQVYRVTRKAEAGSGALLIYGNYMGDVLNFSHAQEKLRLQGLDVRSVRVTDDVASAPYESRETRRGIAGDLFVFKIAGASAGQGDPLDEVEANAQLANNSILTFGVAFDGCTLPGATETLFSIPAGQMSLGLGVHGEPGIGDIDRPTPEELAKILLERILSEPTPNDSKRITVLLNGLGTMKYEELYSIYGYVERHLSNLGFEIVRPEVGELVTSLDMNGCSLSVAWLEKKLEDLWVAPCDSPGFTRQNIEQGFDFADSVITPSEQPNKNYLEPLNSGDYADLVRTIFDAIAHAIAQSEEMLGELDSKTGDGDHGIGMVRGTRGANNLVSERPDAGTIELLSAAAEGWSEAGGGTSGAIWGIILGSIATSLSKNRDLDSGAFAQALEYAAMNVQKIGGAKPGDKTLVDAFVPLVESYSRSVTDGKTFSQAFAKATELCSEAAQLTASMVPRIGRAKTHAKKGLGAPDAGAISLSIVATAVNKAIQNMESK